MAESGPVFDTEAYLRTTSLFAAKREHFAPDAVTALAGDIMTRLADAARRGPRLELYETVPEDLDAFCQALTGPEPRAALDFVAHRRDQGLSHQDVYLGYIAAAARWLGEQWDDDRLSTLQVVNATSHLYALMRAMRARRPAQTGEAAGRRSALFATVPGEDHGIGITIAAELFRDAGWRIDLQIGCGHDDLVSRVEEDAPHVIGLSCSTEARLSGLVRLVVAIRLAAPYAIIGIAPALSMEEDRLRGLVDFDLVFRDAQTARADLERLVQLRA